MLPIALCTNDVTNFDTPLVTQTNKVECCESCKGLTDVRESFTVLTDDDEVPGSKFEREPEEYTVDQLKRWLKCRGLKLSGKRDDLVKHVSNCIKSGNQHTLDPSIDNGKWFAAKVLKESSGLQANSSSISVPFIPSNGWHAFPSHNIPSLFNYGHVHYYALESIQNINIAEEIDDGLGHMTDKPLKNGGTWIRALCTI